MNLSELFSDPVIVNKIQNKLPQLFQMAELETQRAGRVGMEVGSLRERIIVALLIYKFGENNVETEIPITEPEVDVKLFGQPISIKTKTGKSLSGVKLNWTVDAKNSLEFRSNYSPLCDMLFAQIVWNQHGRLFYFPKHVQQKVLLTMKRENYIKLPTKGTNPRGIEITSKALAELIKNDDIMKIDIFWKKEEIKFNTFRRWIDLWAQE